MDSLGSYLKRQRENLGYSLKEVADETKIRMHYLQAIEEGNVRALPSEPYAKGFIKSYALFLGLEPEKVLSQYGWGEIKKETKQKTDSPREIGFGWIFIVCGFILGIVIIAIFAQYAQTGKIDQYGDYTRQAIENLPLVPAIAESAAIESLVQPDTVLPEQLTLEIKAVKRAWITVIADKDTVLSGEIREGAKIEIIAKDRFVINQGKLSACEIFLNGNKLEAFNQPERKIFRAEINRQNFRQYLK